MYIIETEGEDSVVKVKGESDVGRLTVKTEGVYENS